MRIGIDFGTSYTAAAAYIDGELRHISFGGDSQFRTAVFIPEKSIDWTLFQPDAYEQQVRDNLSASTAAYTKALGEYDEATSKIRFHYRSLAKNGDITQEEAQARISLATSELRKPVSPLAAEIRRATISAARRHWAHEQREAGRASSINVDESAVFGEDAIEEFFWYEEGRLIQSPKSMLGFRLAAPQREAIVKIVSNVLKHVRRAATEQLSVDVTEATIGRPVVFRSSMGPEGSDQAVELLREAAHSAGFRSVDFLAEPAAAAITYHMDFPESQFAVVVDVGGGTTDIAVGHVGGQEGAPKLDASWGLAKGGTDVDLGLSLRAVMPLFGKNDCRLLAPFYVDAAMVSDQNRQAAFRKVDVDSIKAPYKKRLLALQRYGVTVRMNRDVERLKVALSSEAEADVSLDYVQKGLRAKAGTSDLEFGYERYMRSFNELLSQVRGATAGRTPIVLLTGGMSRAPYIAEAVKRHFPGSEIHHGDASLGVVGGLAMHAATVHKTPFDTHAKL